MMYRAVGAREARIRLRRSGDLSPVIECAPIKVVASMGLVCGYLDADESLMDAAHGMTI
jgi:hypothetical protein